VSTCEAPLAVDGPTAPPRTNGELLFTEPWESRAFGMVVSLHDTGAFEWSAFQSALVAHISAWEAAPDGEYRYYEHWLAALEDVLDGASTVGRGEVDERAEKLAARPAGHDHAHEAGHGHGH
jgi:nitrile hydratase accessory protein